MSTFLKKLGKGLIKELKNIIIAVLLAVVIWFAISMQIFPDIVTHIDDIPITATPTEYMTSNSLTISDDYVKTISAKVSGKRYDIGNLDKEDFTATLDLSGVKGIGEYTVKVLVAPIKDVDCIIDDETLSVKIKVEKIVKKTFSADDGTLIATATDVIPVDGMKIETVTAEPSVITLTGDSAVLDSISRVEIRSVFAGETKASISSKGQVVFIDVNGAVVENPGITSDNENFKVNVNLFKQKTLPLTVQFTNVPDNFDMSSLKYSIYPETLTISSPDDSVDTQDKFEIGTIDLTELTTKFLQRLTLPINLPKGYKNISGNTSAMITFDADNYTFLSFNVLKDNIRVANVPDNYDVEILTNEISVIVTGPEETISELTSNNITATVDLMGTTLTPGAKELSAEFTVKGKKVNCWVTGEYKISLMVSEKEHVEEN